MISILCGCLVFCFGVTVVYLQVCCLVRLRGFSFVLSAVGCCGN